MAFLLVFKRNYFIINVLKIKTLLNAAKNRVKNASAGKSFYANIVQLVIFKNGVAPFARHGGIIKDAESCLNISLFSHSPTSVLGNVFFTPAIRFKMLFNDNGILKVKGIVLTLRPQTQS